VAVTADGKFVVSASADKTLKVWDLQTGRIVLTIEGHSDRVEDVAVTSDGKRAISASWDKTLKVWDLETGRALLTLEGHADHVMDAVGPAVVPSVHVIRQRFDQRRQRHRQSGEPDDAVGPAAVRRIGDLGDALPRPAVHRSALAGCGRRAAAL